MATMLLMATLGVVDFGRMFNVSTAAANAASAGTMWGALSPANYSALAEMERAAEADTTGYPGANAVATQTCRCELGGPAVPCSDECVSGSRQTYIEVEVTIPFNTVSGIPWIPSVSDVKGKSIVRVE